MCVCVCVLVSFPDRLSSACIASSIILINTILKAIRAGVGWVWDQDYVCVCVCVICVYVCVCVCVCL